MSIAAQIIAQQVTGIIQNNKERLAVELGAENDEQKQRSMAFLFLAAKTAFYLDDEEAFDGIVDGGNDFGVDALYFSQPEDGELPIALIQAKYRQTLDAGAAFPGNGIGRMIDAIDVLFDPDKSITVNSRLNQRVEEIRSFVREGAIPRVIAVATNNGKPWEREAQELIENASGRHGNQVHWRHIGADGLLALLQASESIADQVTLVGQATVEEFDFRRVLIGKMPVSELARLTETYGDQLFDRNIRRYLGLRGNRVNEDMAGTLLDPGDRPNFYFYNNGITIVCSQFSHNALRAKDWTVQVQGLQIVNGGQTSRTAQQVHEGGNSLEGAEVLVRIYELSEDDREVVDQITLFTNSQNPVDLRDLKANDERQKSLAESIKELGYTYRTKREDKPVASDEFTSAVVAEAVLAVWRKRPHQARFRGRQHFGACMTRYSRKS